MIRRPHDLCMGLRRRGEGIEKIEGTFALQLGCATVSRSDNVDAIYKAGWDLKDRNRKMVDLLNAAAEAHASEMGDGWTPDEERDWNSHRVSNVGDRIIYEITFRRWVKP